MNTLYNNYVSESAIEEVASFEKMSLNIDRLLLAYESVCRKEELDIREAEIRCMEESGDIDLLESYYMEASEENKEKKEGILTRIWDAIKEFFRKIKDFLFGEKQMKNLENAAKEGKEADVNPETKTFLDKAKGVLSAFISNIKNIPSQIHDGISEMDAKKKVEASLGIAALLTLVTVGIFKKDANGNNLVKVKAEEVWQFVSGYCKPIMDKIESAIDDVKEKLKNRGSKIQNVVVKAIRDAGNAIKDWVSSALSLFGLGKKNDENEGKLSNLKGKKKKEYEEKKKEIFAKMNPGEEREEALAKLDAEYNASVHESVDDYDLPDDFIEESVCDSEINEIAALLDTI